MKNNDFQSETIRVHAYTDKLKLVFECGQVQHTVSFEWDVWDEVCKTAGRERDTLTEKGGANE